MEMWAYVIIFVARLTGAVLLYALTVKRISAVLAREGTSFTN
jgi:hypothetical protein